MLQNNFSRRRQLDGGGNVLLCSDDEDSDRRGKCKIILQSTATHSMPSTDNRNNNDDGDQLKQVAIENVSTDNRNNSDDGDQEKKVAIESVMKASTPKEFLRAMTREIDESWIYDASEVSGNIYRIAAFGGLELKRSEDCTEFVRANARVFGCILVFLFQVIGPPAIFISTVCTWGILKGQEVKWHLWTPSLDDWTHIALTKVISMIAVSIFSVNALFTSLHEKQAWLQAIEIYRMKDFGWKGVAFLYLDAVVNLWIMVCCTVDACVVLGISQTPQDVLFDSLGLVFLFNLDDVDGELAFVSGPDWPTYYLGWFHKEIKADSSQEIKDPAQDWMVAKIFDIARVFLGIILIVAPVFIAVTPSLRIVPQAPH